MIEILGIPAFDYFFTIFFYFLVSCIPMLLAISLLIRKW